MGTVPGRAAAEFGLPLTFSDRELDELQFPAFIADLKVEREFWNQQLQALASAMPQPPSREELLWALSCACSRTVTCEFGGALPPAQVSVRPFLSHCISL